MVSSIFAHLFLQNQRGKGLTFNCYSTSLKRKCYQRTNIMLTIKWSKGSTFFQISTGNMTHNQSLSVLVLWKEDFLFPKGAMVCCVPTGQCPHLPPSLAAEQQGFWLWVRQCLNHRCKQDCRIWNTIKLNSGTCQTQQVKLVSSTKSSVFKNLSWKRYGVSLGI